MSTFGLGLEFRVDLGLGAGADTRGRGPRAGGVLEVETGAGGDLDAKDGASGSHSVRQGVWGGGRCGRAGQRGWK